MNIIEQFKQDLALVSQHLRNQTYGEIPNSVALSPKYVFNMNWSGNPNATGYGPRGGEGNKHSGTACCIAGLLHVIKCGTHSNQSDCWTVTYYHADDLTTAELEKFLWDKHELFFPQYELVQETRPDIDLNTYWESIHPVAAAEVIDRYIKDDVVDWESFAPLPDYE